MTCGAASRFSSIVALLQPQRDGISFGSLGSWKRIWKTKTRSRETTGIRTTLVAVAASPPAPAVVGRNGRIGALGRLRHRPNDPVPGGLRHSGDPGRMVFGPVGCLGVGDRHAAGSPRVRDGAVETGRVDGHTRGDDDDSRGSGHCNGALVRAALRARARTPPPRADVGRT